MDEWNAAKRPEDEEEEWEDDEDEDDEGDDDELEDVEDEEWDEDEDWDEDDERRTMRRTRRTGRTGEGGSMRAVAQRVTGASVSVGGEEIARIGPGLLVLLGVARSDGTAEADWMGDKLVSLRVFENAGGQVRSIGGRDRRRGAGGLSVHAVRRRAQGAPAVVQRRRAARERRASSTGASRSASRVTASRSGAGASAPTCRWSSSTTGR